MNLKQASPQIFYFMDTSSIEQQSTHLKLKVVGKGKIVLLNLGIIRSNTVVNLPIAVLVDKGVSTAMKVFKLTVLIT